jgi:hypothetical protein
LNKNHLVIFVIPAYAGIGSINREQSEPNIQTMTMFHIAVKSPIPAYEQKIKLCAANGSVSQTRRVQMLREGM